MQDINLRDETLDPNQTHNYHLMVQLGDAELSFCLLNTVTNKFVLLRHFSAMQTNTTEGLIKTMDDEPLFKASYKKVSVVLTNGKSTLVPESYFEPAHAQTLASFNFGDTSSDQVFHTTHTAAGIENVFVNENIELCNAFQKLQPAAKIYPRTSPFLAFITQWPSRGFRFDCFASVNKGYVDFGVVQNRKLEFFNSFEYVHTNDITYYILKASEPFGLKDSHSRFFISTNIANQNEVFDQLNNYLSDIRFIKPSERYTYSYLFDDLYLTRYANLFNLVLCE